MKLLWRSDVGVVHVKDIAEFRELGEQSVQVAPLLTVLQQGNGTQRAIGPATQQPYVRKAGSNARGCC